MNESKARMPPIDISKFEQLKASGDLPSPRGVAMTIVRMTQQDDVALQELARVIKSDPAFVGRLVKAANGILAHTRRPIASVQDALMVLGLPAVRTMALGFSLLSHYREGACQEFDYERYWCASVLTALGMQQIAMRNRCAAPDETFCLGLLCRVGELALATIYPNEYGAAVAEHRQFPEIALPDLEQRAFAMDHRELTAVMLTDWGLPKIFTEAAYYAEQPERSTFAESSREYALTHSLVLAEAIADVCLGTELERPRLMPRVLQLASRIGLDEEPTVALCNTVAADWVEWGKLLQLPAGQMPPFSEIVLAAGEAAKAAEAGQPVAPFAAPAKPGTRVRAASMAELRILIVDDDASIRAVLRGVLEAAGHRVFEAPNGRVGMEMAFEVQPQLMIVDWVMPEMDGMEVTRALRMTKIGRTIYILLLTSLEDDERLIEAFESGVDDFVAKPVKPRVLAARLRAGQRVVRLQQEIEKEREEIRHFAAELAVTNRRLQEVALNLLSGFYY
jgi:HD-like signal output (HDOD) protein/DNA-binding NarL/FixJ family response regulator